MSIRFTVVPRFLSLSAHSIGDTAFRQDKEAEGYALGKGYLRSTGIGGDAVWEVNLKSIGESFEDRY